MPRSLSLVLVILIWLIPSQFSWAHLLNMTRIDVDAEADEIRVSIEIDLGQSLMSSQSYWDASQASESEQRALIDAAITRLDRELVLVVDGETTPRRLSSFEIGASSLEAIENPLTPQMATLNYVASVAGASAVQIAMAEGLEIPWPCLLTVRTPHHRLPQSRLLTDVDRTSQPVFLSASQRLPLHAYALSAWSLERWERLAPWVTWIAVGFQHIIPKGLDHILFVLGLFFFSRGWRQLLIQVTGFTIAHSLTLAMSMYGVVRVSPTLIEPLIALSIVYVALDSLAENQHERWRLAVVVLFGLLHGLGFASVLSDIGLPKEQFLSSLLLFNVGVELGQLAVLVAAFLLAGWYRRQPWYEKKVAHPAAVAIAGTGVYWFLKRIAF
ncbi:MAG: HupE/UreJ family protein [Pseudomonadota bacterium]